MSKKVLHMQIFQSLVSIQLYLHVVFTYSSRYISTCVFIATGQQSKGHVTLIWKCFIKDNGARADVL